MNFMNKYFIKIMAASLLLAGNALASDSGTTNKSCDHEATGHSFLWIRPQFRSVDPIYLAGFRDEWLLAKECGFGGALQVALFGGRTTKEDEIARYFLPFGKTTILVQEDQALDPASTADVYSVNFNVVTVGGNFESTVTLSPHQSTVGLGLHYRQAFYVDEACGRAFWASISGPITMVKNSLNFEEVVTSTGGGASTTASGAVPNMTAAFQQTAWLYSHIYPNTHNSHHKVGLADIELKIGYEWTQHDPCHAESYIGFLIPTGNAVEADFLFSPIVGEGKHWGIMLGSYYGMNIWNSECGEKSLRTEYALHGEYLFKKKQIRSFDLVGKQWSRFLPVYLSAGAALAAQSNLTDINSNSTPGINVFTQPVNVTPGYSVNFTAALVYESCSFNAELGYNFFARQAECVKLAQPWALTPVLRAGTGGTLGAGTGDINPIRDITGNYFLENASFVGVPPAPSLPVQPADFAFAVITENDLDLVSASQPCGISNIVYGSIGCDFDTFCDFPAFANLGGEYEFSRSNNAMVNRWTVWGKVGISF
jgi:hypothetical protein